ncbi:MAG: hypothetical protein M3069_32295 [Chloroflexota bacterium]|nr:hypothetical protein [Chloroflexota bacterium]
MQAPALLRARARRGDAARREHIAARRPWSSQIAPAAEAFAIALFAGVYKTAVEQKTVSLAELRQLLSKFEVLADKRRGRCWSPTCYADGACSRGNAGVLEVSAMVFDCDKVPPDAERLAGVYWLGHTTWSHTPQAPRWRVVIPLTAPVQPRSGATCGDAAGQRYAPRRTRSAKTRAGSITCPVTAAA